MSTISTHLVCQRLYCSETGGHRPLQREHCVHYEKEKVSITNKCLSLQLSLWIILIMQTHLLASLTHSSSQRGREKEITHLCLLNTSSSKSLPSSALKVLMNVHKGSGGNEDATCFCVRPSDLILCLSDTFACSNSL